MSSLVELAVAMTLAAAAIYFVLRPIFAPHAVVPVVEDEGADPDDDFSPRAVALRALKEIEFDRATGKLADADYESLKRRYTAEALTALRAGAEASPLVMTPAVAAPARSCPTHGPRSERDAQHCSECGRRLGEAPGFCPRCGVAIEFEAQFCSACGRRVAA